MKSINRLLALLAILFLAHCSDKRKMEEETVETKPVERTVYPFEFLNSRAESIGSRTNMMDLYVPVGTLDLESLRTLCSELKEYKRDNAIYFMVVFDKKENAVFPNNPFTALYGIDEEPQRHILAVYQYSSLNGVSKLASYTPNMWEGKPKTLKVY